MYVKFENVASCIFWVLVRFKSFSITYCFIVENVCENRRIWKMEFSVYQNVQLGQTRTNGQYG